MADYSAQLNSLSILLHLATVESIAVALAYDTILSTHLEELARARAIKIAGEVDFMGLLSTEQHRFMIHAIAQAAKSAPKPDVHKVVSKAVSDAKSTAVPKRQWIPRKQYLAQLTAEKKASEDAAVAAAASS